MDYTSKSCCAIDYEVSYKNERDKNIYLHNENKELRKRIDLLLKEIEELKKSELTTREMLIILRLIDNAIIDLNIKAMSFEKFGVSDLKDVRNKIVGD